MSEPATTPTAEEKEEIMLSCRYGELDDVQQYVEKHGADELGSVRDDNGNTVLHMVCGNGHEDLLDYFLHVLPPALLAAPNSARSTPLHWAALNAHLGVAQRLVRHPGGPGVDLIDAKNAAGHTPLGEAEMAGWEEGARWFVEVMNLDGASKGKEEEAEEEMKADGADIEVEIEDADGQVAKMSISQRDAGGSEDKP